MKITLGISPIVKLYRSGNVCLTGLRGRGKDLLTANVISRRKNEPYVSNINYGGKYIKLDFEDINCGRNTYKDLIDDTVKPYVFPHPFGSDVYISDAGIYLPAQYCDKLNRDFPYLATYAALSRQLSANNVHINTQALPRLYDKLREQSDTYITANYVYKPLLRFGWVLQVVTIYEKYQSCVDKVKPPKVRTPLLNPEARAQVRTYLDNYETTHGKITRRLLFYRNKSTYDTNHFRNLFAPKQ